MIVNHLYKETSWGLIDIADNQDGELDHVHLVEDKSMINDLLEGKRRGEKGLATPMRKIFHAAKLERFQLAAQEAVLKGLTKQEEQLLEGALKALAPIREKFGL